MLEHRGDRILSELASLESIQGRAHPLPDARVFDERHAARAGVVLVWVVAALFVMIALRVVLRGAPFNDDYQSCVEVARNGLPRVLAHIADLNGAIRPARFVEVALIGSLCRSVPFSLLILVPLGLTLIVGAQLHGLLRDLMVPPPWPAIGAALWFLQPLGAEAALWPSALHIPLGLALALGALRLYRRQRYWAAVPLGLAACLSVEQVIFALPALVWLVVPPGRRKTAVALAGATSLLVLVAYQQWPGSAPRGPSTFVDILLNPFRGPMFYVRFPATSLGLHSIPLAVLWAFPLSLVLLAGGAAVGWLLGPRLLARTPRPAERNGTDGRWLVAIVALLIVLFNLPVVLAYPHATAGRVFTPTWAMLAAFAALGGSLVHWRRPRVAASVAGFLATAALLSIAFSVSVRVRTADFAEASFKSLGRRVPPNGVIAICDIRRTATRRAPVGEFHTSEFLGEWPEYALTYHAGVTAQIRRGGQYWNSRCPDVRGADVVVSFDQLTAAYLR